MTKYNKNTKIIFSISTTPGNFGTFFHNYLYSKLGLDFFYKSCPCHCLEDSLKAILSLELHGMSVSMPFKQKVLPLLHELDSSAEEAQGVNTIVNLYNGKLRGYNTDLYALKTILGDKLTDIKNVLILGNGAIAQMCTHYLKDKNIFIQTRDEKQYLNFKKQNPKVEKFGPDKKYQLIINATDKD